MLLGGVVNENVDPAPALNDSSNGTTTESLVTDVPGEDVAVTASLPDESTSFARVAMLIQIEDCHVGPLGGKRDGDRAPNSAISPADDRHLAGQSARAQSWRPRENGTRYHSRLDSRLPTLRLRRPYRLGISLQLRHRSERKLPANPVGRGALKPPSRRRSCFRRWCPAIA